MPHYLINFPKPSKEIEQLVSATSARCLHGQCPDFGTYAWHPNHEQWKVSPGPFRFLVDEVWETIRPGLTDFSKAVEGDYSRKIYSRNVLDPVAVGGALGRIDWEQETEPSRQEELSYDWIKCRVGMLGVRRGYLPVDDSAWLTAICSVEPPRPGASGGIFEDDLGVVHGTKGDFRQSMYNSSYALLLHMQQANLTWDDVLGPKGDQFINEVALFCVPAWRLTGGWRKPRLIWIMPACTYPLEDIFIRGVQEILEHDKHFGYQPGVYTSWVHDLIADRCISLDYSTWDQHLFKRILIRIYRVLTELQDFPEWFGAAICTLATRIPIALPSGTHSTYLQRREGMATSGGRTFAPINSIYNYLIAAYQLERVGELSLTNPDVPGVFFGDDGVVQSRTGVSDWAQFEQELCGALLRGAQATKGECVFLRRLYNCDGDRSVIFSRMRNTLCPEFIDPSAAAFCARPLQEGPAALVAYIYRAQTSGVTNQFSSDSVNRKLSELWERSVAPREYIRSEPSYIIRERVGAWWPEYLEREFYEKNVLHLRK